ncbi:MAG: hypothetical protein C5B50_21910 [Verrucomicrobia bacterium]|nr:MAG: hypothetical protein C5B50_21910 [Verrucomicrobiota bacterium]
MRKAFAAGLIAMCALAAQAKILRIVSYNIDCADQGSDNNITGSAHTLPTVVQGIGLHHIGPNAQPIDVMGCEELQSTTLSNFVVQLNNIYGAGKYAFDPTADPNTGGGPDGIIYNTQTIQVVSARALRTGDTVLLQSNGTYVAAHNVGGGVNGVTRAPMVYLLRPIGFGTTNDFYMYVSHARSTSDNSVGDARYAEAQEVRSDAKYNLPAGSHILYSGDWNLFNGSNENAYKCLTGQSTSDAINWADNSAIWGNSRQTQAYDPTSKTVPPTTTTWTNGVGDNATYLYGDSTGTLDSRIDIQLMNAPMFGVYNSQGGVQIAPDTSDPFDTSNFPSSKYGYAFEVFGNNGSTPRSSSVTSSFNHSLDDLNFTTPSAPTVYSDILLTGSGSTFTGSDHYPVVGDYVIVLGGAVAPVASFSGSPTNGPAPLSVTFSDTSSGSITNHFWSFGDGVTTNIASTNVAHSYTNGGSFTVTEVVSGPGGSSTNSKAAYITVLVPPTITTQPHSQTNTAGQNATFSVVATGSAPLGYQWRFNNSNIPGATNTSFSLTPAQGSNYGSYSVVVTNGQGFAVSSNALLAVLSSAAWGDDSWGQTNAIASLTNVVAIAAGAWHSMALRADGSILAWGDDVNGQCDVPAGAANSLAIAAGGYHSMAIRSDWSVVAWGNNDYGQTNVPGAPGQVIGISAGTWHSLALRRDGTVIAWGDNTFGQCNVPVGLSNVVAVAAGGNHSMALSADGTVSAWGENTNDGGMFTGQSIVPVGLSNVVAIGAGKYHSLAVRADGSLAAWGDDSQGQTDVPAGLSNVVAVAGGGAHTLALKQDGTLAAWGSDANHQIELPTLGNVIGLAAGEAHSMALVAGNVPVLQLLSPALQGSSFSVLAQSLYRKTYSLDFKSVITDVNWMALATNSGNGALKLFTDPTATAPQKFYRLRQF